MPASVFLRAKKEWMCMGCGELIPRGMRYYRRRLLTLCLMCHREAEGVLGPQPTHTPPPPSQRAGCQVNGENGSKKR